MTVLSYIPQKHERTIIRHFGAANCVPSEASRFHAGPSIFFCFTNRSGSNFVVDSFVKAGVLKSCGEYFNVPLMMDRIAEKEVFSFPDFCSDMAEEKATPDGVFGTKMAWSQLFFLHRTGIIPAIFRDPRYMLIRRKDLLAQAISATIAFQTRRFRHSHKGNGEEAKYNFDFILDQIKVIASANAAFIEFFAVSGVPYHEIVYEDFMAAPQEYLEKACGWLSLPCGKLDMNAISPRMQRDSRNAEFRVRFLADAAERGALGVRDESLWRFLPGRIRKSGRLVPQGNGP